MTALRILFHFLMRFVIRNTKLRRFNRKLYFCIHHLESNKYLLAAHHVRGISLSSGLILKVSLLLIITMEIITLTLIPHQLSSSKRSRYCTALDADKSLLFSL